MLDNPAREQWGRCPHHHQVAEQTYFYQFTSEALLECEEVSSPEDHPGMWSAREISSGNAGGHPHWSRLSVRLLRDKQRRFLGRKWNHESEL